MDRLSQRPTGHVEVGGSGCAGRRRIRDDFRSWRFFRWRSSATEPASKFLAIVSSATLATMLARRSEGRVDGFVVELAQAGGHNAPPRGELRLNAAGEPIYGPRDDPDLKAIQGLGLPFWLAGGFASASGFAKARLAGAAGVQVGTAFAFCDESDLDPELKEQVLKAQPGRRRARADRPGGFADRFPLQSRRTGRHVVRSGPLREAPTRLRSRVISARRTAPRRGRWVGDARPSLSRTS
jgi:hypothetical protein